MKRPLWFGILALFAIPLTLAQTSNLKKYVGQSSCTPRLQKGPGSYGIRLDKRQIARVEARTVNGKKALLIVQYQKEWSECGVVKDIVVAARADNDFIFECADDKDPGAVVVGTWQTPKISGRSPESWRIDLKSLRFVRIGRSLRYAPQKLEGDDDGSDLVDWANHRAASHKSHVGH